MKIVVKVGDYYVTEELAEKLTQEKGEKILILENISDWDQRENSMTILSALEKLTQEERELLIINISPSQSSRLWPTMSSLNLSPRLYNCLKSADKVHLTVKEFFETTEVADTMKFRNFGKNSLIELEKIAEKFGLSFGGN